MSSETNLEGESVINLVLDGNGLEMSREKTDKSSRSMTNIDDNEEHEILSLTLASQNIENETSGKFF